MSKYNDLDAKMLHLINNGCDTFGSLITRLAAEAEAIPGAAGEGWRIIDRRLQSLRKSGKIACKRWGRETVWYVKEVA